MSKCFFLNIFIIISANFAFSQNSIPALKAIDVNGKIVIEVGNLTVLNQYFVHELGDSISLDFYFGEDDIRNKVYKSKPQSQLSGRYYLRFEGLYHDANMQLSFSMIETLQTGILKEYIFRNGDLVDRGPCNINVCPSAINCGNAHELGLVFDENDVILGLDCLPVNVTLFSPNFSGNGTYQVNGFLPDGNELSFSRIFKTAGFNADVECPKIFNGVLVVTINGKECIYDHGELLTDQNNCSYWTDYLNDNNSDCAQMLEYCHDNLISFLSETKKQLPCLQWVENGMIQCSTFSFGSRTGKVAIGTDRFASNSKLTVKNGIITDRARILSRPSPDWPDYVFDPSQYTLFPIDQLNTYLHKYKHLPNTLSGSVIEKEGAFEVGQITINQQERIEDLFLYLIDLDQEVELLEMSLLLKKIKLYYELKK